MIDYHSGEELEHDYFKIKDNSIGMDEEDLKKAFLIGTPPEITDGRSRYGLGMKTAAFWLGDEWSIITKKLGHNKICTVNLDVNSISHGNLVLDIHTEEADENEHYTIITINKLHRKFKGKTISKIKSFLASIYRFDIESNELFLFWNREQRLEWSPYSDDDFIKNIEGTPY